MPLMVDPNRRKSLMVRSIARLKSQKLRDNDPRFERWRTDFPAWLRERLGETLWSRQEEVAQSLVVNRRTAVPSAHDVGKSWLAGRAVAWWLDVHAPGDAFVVTTSATGAQVKAILWREINRAKAAGNLPGRTNQTEWWIGDELVSFGRKPSEYNPTAFQGIHARHVLVVIDEACGVPKSIFDAAGSLAANEGSRILATGNPDDPMSHFETICRPGSGWSVVPIDGAQSPNFTDEEIPERLRDLLLSPIYERELAKDEGCLCTYEKLTDHEADCPAMSSPVYLAKVRGQFAMDADDGVVPISWARRCQRLELEPGDEVALGVDVGAGGDETTIRERRGPVAGRTWGGRTPDWSVAVTMVLDALEETGAKIVNVDSNGIGWGIYGRLVDLKIEGAIPSDILITPVNVGERSNDPAKFPRLRDQLWWEIGRELSRANAWDLGACNDRTIAQLCAPKFVRQSNGITRVEPKAETKKRLGRSPDDADALLLAFFNPPSVSFWRL